jgi:tetratricopeptide (TPR) repeat protein
VDTVLEGSVSKAGNQLRITTQLINIADGYHLWSEDYDREMQDIFAVRTDVAQRVADALQVELGVETQRRIKRNPTDNLAAYELYLKGRFYTIKWTKEGLRKGAEYFGQAIAIDPNYALAYNGLANNYIIAADYTVPAKTAMLKAKEAARRALAIDDTLAEAHAFLAVAYLWFDWDWPAGEREFKRAIELDPNSAVVREMYGAYYLAAMGHTDQAIAECERARQIDPLSLEANTLLGLSLIFARRYDEALEQLRKTVDMEPNFWPAHHYLGLVYAEAGKFQEAISEFQTARRLEGSILEIVGMLGWAYALAGQREEATRVLDELNEQAQRQYVPPFDIAVVHIGLGDNDRAFEWLEKMYVDRSYMLTWLRYPVFDSLRSDPRFTELMKKVGLER